MPQTPFTATPSVTAALLGWRPFYMMDLDFERPHETLGTDYIGGTAYNTTEAIDLLREMHERGFTLTNITLFD